MIKYFMYFIISVLLIACSTFLLVARQKQTKFGQYDWGLAIVAVFFPMAFFAIVWYFGYMGHNGLW